MRGEITASRKRPENVRDVTDREWSAAWAVADWEYRCFGGEGYDDETVHGMALRIRDVYEYGVTTPVE